MQPSHNFLTELRTFMLRWSAVGAAMARGRGMVSAPARVIARMEGKTAARRRQSETNIVAAVGVFEWRVRGR